VKLGESPNHLDAKLIPRQTAVKRMLSFQNTWYQKFPWLHYSSEVQGILCFHCAKAEERQLADLSKRRETVFSISGFRNWKKAIDRFGEHEKSQSHKFSVQQLLQQSQPVDHQLDSQRKAGQEQSRSCLSVIFTSIQYLARQGQALRGHHDSDGNLLQLLKLRAQDVLR